jgi:uncharacterized protein YrzB (UPF0473 family)
MSNDVKVVELIKKVHGDHVILFDEQGDELEFHLLKEIEWNRKVYAILQHPDDEDEVEIFLVSLAADGSYELETIEDEEEWEKIAEIFDDLFYNE